MEAMREGMRLHPFLLRSGRGRDSEVLRHKDEQSIATLYKDNGFRNVKVASTVQNDYRSRANDIAVTLSIEEGPQWTVAHIELKTEQEQEPQMQMNKEAGLSPPASAHGQTHTVHTVAA